MKHSCVHALLAIVALFDLEFEQLDVKTAFLHTELEEHIYMQQARGFVVQGKNDHVSLLRKSIIWFEAIS